MLAWDKSRIFGYFFILVNIHMKIWSRFFKEIFLLSFYCIDPFILIWILVDNHWSSLCSNRRKGSILICKTTSHKILVICPNIVQHFLYWYSFLVWNVSIVIDLSQQFRIFNFSRNNNGRWKIKLTFILLRWKMIALF